MPTARAIVRFCRRVIGVNLTASAGKIFDWRQFRQESASQAWMNVQKSFIAYRLKDAFWEDDFKKSISVIV